MKHKFNIESTDASAYQVSQLQILVDELNTDLQEDNILSPGKLRAIYTETVKYTADLMMVEDIYGVFLVYDLIDKVIQVSESEEEFRLCYNMFELLKMLHKEYDFELSLFMEIE